MRQKSGTESAGGEGHQGHRRVTRRQYSAEERIRIVLEGLAARSRSPRFCRREGIARASITTGRRSSWKPARSGLAGDHGARGHQR